MNGLSENFHDRQGIRTLLFESLVQHHDCEHNTDSHYIPSLHIDTDNYTPVVLFSITKAGIWPARVSSPNVSLFPVSKAFLLANLFLILYREELLRGGGSKGEKDFLSISFSVDNKIVTQPGILPPNSPAFVEQVLTKTCT